MKVGSSQLALVPSADARGTVAPTSGHEALRQVKGSHRSTLISYLEIEILVERSAGDIFLLQKSTGQFASAARAQQVTHKEVHCVRLLRSRP